MTGAASGIGRAVALRLAEEGCHLYLWTSTCRDSPKRNGWPGRRESKWWPPAAISATARKSPPRTGSCLRDWGQLDILVNNAGVVFAGPTEDMTAPQWQWLLSINLLAPIQFVRELLPVLRSNPGAHIVNIASIYGLVAFGRFTAYNVSKFGLVGWASRSRGIRQGLGVSTICPGFVAPTCSAPRFRDIATAGGRCRRGACVRRPARVAEKVVLAIHRDRRMTLITPLAHVALRAEPVFTGLIDLANRLGRRHRLAKMAAQLGAAPGRDAYNTDGGHGWTVISITAILPSLAHRASVRGEAGQGRAGGLKILWPSRRHPRPAPHR